MGICVTGCECLDAQAKFYSAQHMVQQCSFVSSNYSPDCADTGLPPANLFDC